MPTVLYNSYGKQRWEDYLHEHGYDKCQHKNETRKTVGNCLTQYDCPDCGLSYQVDSSD